MVIKIRVLNENNKKIINNIIGKDKYSKNQAYSHCENMAHLGFNIDETNNNICPECKQLLQ